MAIQRGPKLELISYTSHSYLFLSLCEDVEVVIEGLKIRHLIFIVRTRDHDLILGQSFLNLVKFSQEYKPDRIFGTIIHLYIHQSAVFRTLALYNPANQIEPDLFLVFKLDQRHTQSLQSTLIFSLKIWYSVWQFSLWKISVSLHF